MLDPRQVGQHLLAADGGHDMVEPREEFLAGDRPQVDLDVLGAVDRVLVEVQQRLPSAPVGCAGGDPQMSSQSPTFVKQRDLVLGGQRDSALEPGRSRADDSDAARACGCAGPGEQGHSRPGSLPGRSEIRVDRAQQDRIERAAVLVAGHAGTDLLGASRQDLCREVRIRNQGSGHADEVRARLEGGLDRTGPTERLRDEQRTVDDETQAIDRSEQRRFGRGHVTDVRGPHPDGHAHVVHQRRDRRQQFAQPVQREAAFALAVDREPDAEDQLRGPSAGSPPRSG